MLKLAFISCFLFTHSFAVAGPTDFPKDGSFTLGNTRVHFILGNIANQRADVYVAASWDTAISDGAAAGAIWDGGANAGFETLKQIYEENDGIVPSLSAHLVASGGGNSQYVVNVASLQAERDPYIFKTRAQLDASDLKLTHDERLQYGILVDAYEKATERSDKWSIERMMLKLVERFEPDMHQTLRQVVAEAIFNSLQATESVAEIKTFATPVLGNGIMGDLSYAESWQATLAGLQAYLIKNPESKITDFGIVVYAQPNSKNQKAINKILRPYIEKGSFYDFKFSTKNPIAPTAEQWLAAKETFLKNAESSGSKNFFAQLIDKFLTLCSYKATEE